MKKDKRAMGREEGKEGGGAGNTPHSFIAHSHVDTS